MLSDKIGCPAGRLQKGVCSPPVSLSSRLRHHDGFVRRVRRLRETGGRKAPRQGYPKRSILDPHEDFLLGLVAGEVDVTLDEICVRLRDACGIMAARVTIRRFCYRRGITFKERRAMRRSRSAKMSTPPALPGSRANLISTPSN